MVVGNHVGVAVFGLVHLKVGMLPSELLTRVNGLEKASKNWISTISFRIPFPKSHSSFFSVPKYIKMAATIYCLYILKISLEIIIKCIGWNDAELLGLQVFPFLMHTSCLSYVCILGARKSRLSANWFALIEDTEKQRQAASVAVVIPCFISSRASPVITH